MKSIVSGKLGRIVGIARSIVDRPFSSESRATTPSFRMLGSLTTAGKLVAVTDLVKSRGGYSVR